MPDKEYYYRFENSSSEIIFNKFLVLKHTPCGVWIKYWGVDKKFILNNTRKKFAAKTLEEAEESFLKRKEKQAEIYRAKLKDIEYAIDNFKNDKYYLQYPLVCE